MKTRAEELRSSIMRSVRSVNTAPEMFVRRLVHGMGYRYRLHRKDLPGKPDLVFTGRRKVVFVHGCFWHGHTCQRGARIPKSNTQYWLAKINRNRDRDARVEAALTVTGWSPLVVWECELKQPEALTGKLKAFLD